VETGEETLFLSYDEYDKFMHAEDVFNNKKGGSSLAAVLSAKTANSLQSIGMFFSIIRFFLIDSYKKFLIST